MEAQGSAAPHRRVSSGVSLDLGRADYGAAAHGKAHV